MTRMFTGAYLVQVRGGGGAGDRFMVIFTDPEKDRRAGYSFSTTEEMSEADVRARWPDDADRLLAGAREAYAKAHRAD